MLKKLTQIENEMDECLMSVDADDDVAETASSLRRTCSENACCTSPGGLHGDIRCHKTVATSKSDQGLSWRCGWNQTQSVGDETTRDTVTSGIQLADDDDAADGGVFLDVFPTTATAPVVITSPDTDVSEPSCRHGQTDVPKLITEATDGFGSSGTYISGLARSTSDVTSQRRFHRRRSAARCMTGLAPVSGLYVSASHLYVSASHLPAPRHGHSCSAIGDTIHCDATEPGSSNDPPQPEVKEQQQVLDVRSGICPTKIKTKTFPFWRRLETKTLIPKAVSLHYCLVAILSVLKQAAATTKVKEQQLVEELDNRHQSSSSDPCSRQCGTSELETDVCISESVSVLPGPVQHRCTSESILKTTGSSQSLDVAITVEVCDSDDMKRTDTDDSALARAPHHNYLINIPPVTISSHTSTPDDDSADCNCIIAMNSSPTGDRSSQFTSVFSSPAVQSHLSFPGGSESNPNFLSVSRTTRPSHHDP